MAFLHHSHGTDDTTQDSQSSWIASWLKRYAQASLTKYEQLEVHAGEQGKVTFSSSAGEKDKLELMFGDDKDLSAVDKLSQVMIYNFVECIYSATTLTKAIQQNSMEMLTTVYFIFHTIQVHRNYILHTQLKLQGKGKLCPFYKEIDCVIIRNLYWISPILVSRVTYMLTMDLPQFWYGPSKTNCTLQKQ